jgi:trigger factor
MHVTTTPAEKSTVLLEVELPAADLARAVVDATRRLSQRTRIPGFRPGKAPRSMVERELGPGAVLDEAVEQLVERSFRAAMAEQTDLFAIGRPAIDVVQAEEGQPFRFTATIPVRPEVRLGDYRAFPFAPEIDTVDDPKVDRVVDELRDQQASLVPVEERGAKDDDWAVIGFVGTRDGEPFEGGTLERMPIVIGQERLMPGFDEHLVGLRAGDSTEFDITFPLDYREASLQGAAAHFTVTMRELREKVLPAADDAFAASLGEFEDLATLRSEVRTRLERSAIDRARHGFADRIIDYAVKNATVEIPDLLVDEEIEVMHDELRGALARQGITEEAYLKATEKTPEQLHADFRPGAQERAKTILVLGKIAEAEGTEVTDADVAGEASRAKQRYANDPKLAVYFDTGRARAAIRSSLRRSRVVEKVIDDWLAAHPEHPAIPHREDPTVAAGAAAVAGAAVAEAGSARA